VAVTAFLALAVPFELEHEWVIARDNGFAWRTSRATAVFLTKHTSKICGDIEQRFVVDASAQFVACNV